MRNEPKPVTNLTARLTTKLGVMLGMLLVTVVLIVLLATPSSSTKPSSTPVTPPVLAAPSNTAARPEVLTFEESVEKAKAILREAFAPDAEIVRAIEDIEFLQMSSKELEEHNANGFFDNRKPPGKLKLNPRLIENIVLLTGTVGHEALHRFDPSERPDVNMMDPQVRKLLEQGKVPTLHVWEREEVVHGKEARILSAISSQLDSLRAINDAEREYWHWQLPPALATAKAFQLRYRMKVLAARMCEHVREFNWTLHQREVSPQLSTLVTKLDEACREFNIELLGWQATRLEFQRVYDITVFAEERLKQVLQLAELRGAPPEVQRSIMEPVLLCRQACEESIQFEQNQITTLRELDQPWKQ